MEWVVQLAGYHRFRYLVVENVVDICKWSDLGRWYAEMEAHGYRHRTCFLNAMFFGVPQSRDRFYAVFWQKDCPAPDLDFRPPAWCPNCLAVIDAIQGWKNPRRQFGRYREQYLYYCPSCGSMALPFVTPALAAIDLTLPITRIGDRPKPLAAATMRRIQAGIERYWGWPTVMDTMRDPKHRDAEGEPLPTQTGRQSLGLAYYIPLLVPSGGTWRTDAVSADAPMPTRTGSENDGLLTPPLATRLRGTQDAHIIGSSRPAADGPLGGITGGGSHHALVVKNYGNADAAGTMTLPADHRPLGTVTGRDHHALLLKAAGNTWEREPGACRIRPGADHPMWAQSGSLEHGLVVGYSGPGAPTRSGGEPLPTMAGENPYGLVVPVNGGRHGDGGHKVRSVEDPLLTQTGDLARALVYAGQHANRSRPASEPLPTATGGNNVGLVVPLDQRGPGRNNRARTVGDPLGTQGSIQADGLVVHAGSGGDGRVRSTGDPLPTQVANTRPSVVLPPHSFLSAYYRTTVNRDVREPMPTQRGHDAHALVRRGAVPLIEECGFRMLEPQEELKPGMGFGREYIVLGNKRDSTQQIGQAVCPPVAAALVGRLVDAWRRGGER
jgi:site-specific DNA-cytosine methylase